MFELGDMNTDHTVPGKYTDSSPPSHPILHSLLLFPLLVLCLQLVSYVHE